MGREEKITSKRSTSSGTQIQKRTAISDDSDEEYRVEEDEIDEQSDDIVSLVGDASEEEGFQGFVKEEDEEDDVASMRRVPKSKLQNGSSRRKKGFKRSTNRRQLSYDGKDDDYEYEDEEDEDDDYEDEVDEDEEDVVSVSRAPKSKSRNGSSQRKIGLNKSACRKRSSYDEDDDDYEYENEEDEDDDFENVDEEDEEDLVSVSRVPKSNLRNGSIRRKRGFKNVDDEDEEDLVSVSRVPKSDLRNGSIRRKRGFKKSTNRKRSSYDGKDDDYDEEEEQEEEEEEEEDNDDDYEDEDDAEFSPDDLDSLEEEEFLSATEKPNSNGWRTVKKTNSSKNQKTNSRAKAIRKPVRKKRRKTTKPKRKSNSRNHSKKVPGSRGNGKRKPSLRKKKTEPCSDSDFVSSEASDFEYTISEEEREQIREANEFCRRVDTSLRSTNLLLEDAPILKPGPHTKAKGKEKLEDVKNDVGKPLCGICFTEEGKNTVRGTLNCCSHFFCFACIIEWSKVESRCPLCKQRFSTISKPVRSATRIDMRNVVIHVPERDQVYQPSEEELRNYLDPYENMICNECHEGGDDALMLLCDICDSPAHTYCVGLGREVPEGNWYCEGCRPSAQNSQSLDHTPPQRSGVASMLSEPYENMSEIDLNVSVPETPMTPLNEFLPSPRNQGGGNPAQPSVPISGLGVSTLSGRRRVHRLQYLISSNRLSQMAGISDRSSINAAVSSLLGSQVERANESPFAENRISGVGPSGHSLYADRVENNPFGRARGGENIPGRQGLLRGQALVPGAADGVINGCLQRGRGTNGSRFGLAGLSVHEPLHPCSSRSNVCSDRVASSQYGSVHQVKEQLYSMVTNQLKIFCRDVDLGHETVRQIARSSMHILLATCGLEHRRSEVYVPPPICTHGGDTWALEGGTCPVKDCCQSCFNSFVEDAVRTIVNLKAPQLLGYRRN